MSNQNSNPVVQLQPGVFSRTERDRYARADPDTREVLLLEAKRRVAAFDADAFPTRVLPERTGRCYWFRCGNPTCPYRQLQPVWPIAEHHKPDGTSGLGELRWEGYRLKLYDVADGEVWLCERCAVTRPVAKPKASSCRAVCVWCQGVFEAQRSTARYCCEGHRIEARLARKRATTPWLQRRRSKRSR